MRVNICGIPHEVDFVDDTFAGQDSNFDLITYSECRIRINKNMPKDIQRRTIIHEMVHGMLLHIGREDLTQNETFVQTLAIAIDEGFEIKYLEKGGE